MQIFHNQNLGKLSLMKSIKINKIIGEKSNPIFLRCSNETKNTVY